MSTENTTNPGPTESTRDALIADIKGIAGKAESMARNAGQTVSNEFSSTRQAISDKACSAVNATDDYVRSNPWAIVGVAAAVGVLIGTLISRR